VLDVGLALDLDLPVWHVQPADVGPAQDAFLRGPLDDEVLLGREFEIQVHDAVLLVEGEGAKVHVAVQLRHVAPVPEHVADLGRRESDASTGYFPLTIDNPAPLPALKEFFRSKLSNPASCTSGFQRFSTTPGSKANQSMPTFLASSQH